MLPPAGPESSCPVTGPIKLPSSRLLGCIPLPSLPSLPSNTKSLNSVGASILVVLVYTLPFVPSLERVGVAVGIAVGVGAGAGLGARLGAGALERADFTFRFCFLPTSPSLLLSLPLPPTPPAPPTPPPLTTALTTATAEIAAAVEPGATPCMCVVVLPERIGAWDVDV